MLTPQQIAALFDYTKYYRMQTQRVINEAKKNRSLDAELRADILKEQNRRLRELTRLEKALGDEIDILNEEQPQGVKKDAKKIKQSKAARTKANEGSKPTATGQTTRRNGAGGGLVSIRTTAAKKPHSRTEQAQKRTNNDIPAADNHRPPADHKRRVKTQCSKTQDKQAQKA